MRGNLEMKSPYTISERSKRMYPYYPPYQMPYIQQQQQQAQPTIICEWVQSESAASAMPMPPIGVTGIYMDVAQPLLYKREMGTDGKPLPMETYRLVKENKKDAPAPVQKDDLKAYVKTEEMESIVEDMVCDEVERRMSEISFKPTRKTTKGE